jgi:hypothetical protein
MLTRSIGTAQISRLSPAHWVAVPLIQQSSVASGLVINAIYPHSAPARLVDVIHYQVGAGVGGTSYTLDVKNAAGTSLLTTLSVATLASGADKVTDARGEIALPAGWTRPVLKTDTTVDVTKGTKLRIETVETGTFSTHPTFIVVLIFEPKQ